MGQYVNACGTSSFKDEKPIEETDHLSTLNDKINVIINNLSSNEQNTILAEELKKQIADYKKVNDDIRFQIIFLKEQQQNLLTNIENLEKKNTQAEASIKDIKTRIEDIEKNGISPNCTDPPRCRDPHKFQGSEIFTAGQNYDILTDGQIN
jgi:seryl-tRNA synthetase